MIKIVKLNSADWEQFKTLRLYALQGDPDAFGISYEEVSNRDDDYWVSELDTPKLRIWYGAIIDGKIVGLIEVKFATLRKFSHISKISGVYVIPEYRQKGIGTSLLKGVIAEIFSNPNLQKIKLTVNAERRSAVKLYSKLGFRKVAILKKEFRIGNKYSNGLLMELLKEDYIKEYNKYSSND